MIRIVKMHFREEETENFLELFEQVCSKINTFPGCSGVKLLRDKHTKEIFFTYSLWDKEESLENYRSSELFKDTWKRTKAMFAEKAEAWSMEEVGFDKLSHPGIKTAGRQITPHEGRRDDKLFP